MKHFLALLLSCLMLLTLCPATMAAQDAAVSAPLLGSELIRDYVQNIRISLSEPVQLNEGVHGRWYPGWNSVTGEESDWFSYDPLLRSDLRLTVTFSQSGAARYNQGQTTFTGTADEVSALFFDYSQSQRAFSCPSPGYNGDQSTKHWQPGEKHRMQLRFLDVTWLEFEVVTAPDPVVSIVVTAPEGIVLERGADSYELYDYDEFGSEHSFDYYTVDNRGDLRYTVTFSESGAAQYGRDSFTGSRWEVGDLLGQMISWRCEQTWQNRWTPGTTHEAELWCRNKRWQTVQVTIAGSAEPRTQDLNQDGSLDVQDLQALYERLSANTAPAAGADACDINGDRAVNILDYQALYEAIRAA